MSHQRKPSRPPSECSEEPLQDEYLAMQERNLNLCEVAYGVPRPQLTPQQPRLSADDARQAAREYTAPMLQILDESLAPLMDEGSARDRLRVRVLAQRVRALRLHIAPLLELEPGDAP